MLTVAIYGDENVTTYARWKWERRLATTRNDLNVYILVHCEHENVHISNLRGLGHTSVTTVLQDSLF
jgi:hypothetical protein